MNLDRVVTIARGFLRRQTRDPVAIFFMVFAPIMLAIVFGLADQRANESLPIAIVHTDDGSLADDLADQLDDRPELRVRTFDDRASLEDAIRRGDVYAGVVLPTDYDELVRQGTAHVEIIGDESDSAFAAASAGITLVVDRENQALLLARNIGTDVDDARGEIDKGNVNVTRITAHDTSRASGLGRATAGMLVYFVFETAMYSGSTMLDDRRRGVVARMATTATRNSEIITGEVLGRLMLAAIQIAFVILAGTIALSIDWGDPLGVFATVTLFVLVATGIGVGVGCRKNTEYSVFGRTGVVAVMGLLGGCFFALALVGDWLRVAGHFTPHAWAVDALSRLVSTTAGISAIITPLMVLMGAAAASLIWVAVRFERALER